MKVSFRSTFLQYVTVQLVAWYCSAFIIFQLFCSSLNMIIYSTKLGRKKSVGFAVSNENCATAVHFFQAGDRAYFAASLFHVAFLSPYTHLTLPVSPFSQSILTFNTFTVGVLSMKYFN